MPSPRRRCKRCQVLGRLYSEWMRTGKKVPEGFEGTLLEYASKIVAQTYDEEAGATPESIYRRTFS